MTDVSSLKIPSANEFSPGIVDLKTVLNIVNSNRDGRDKITEALRKCYFSDHAKSHIGDSDRRLKEQNKLANNICIGLSSYGLFDINAAKLTGEGLKLLSVKNDDLLKEAFAEYILKKMNGIELLDVIRNMQRRKAAITKKSLADELNKSGFTTAQGKKIPLNTTDHTKLLQWLREASLLPKRGYEINESVFRKLAGIAREDVDKIYSLTNEQRCFLRTLRRLAEIHQKESIFAKDIIRNCEIQHGPVFNNIADQLSKFLYQPLEELDWIKLSGRGAGRGGSSGKVSATNKLINFDPDLLRLGEFQKIPSDLRGELNKPIDQIYQELKAKDTYVKGLALEILSYRISSELGLELLKFRLRSSATNGAEVDLICEGVHLHYSRWLIQCKNTKMVHVSALAKEIGMAMLLNANVIVLVTTGKFSKAVVEHAKGLAEKTPLQAVLIDKSVLSQYVKSGISALLSFFHENARETMIIKRRQIEGKEDLDGNLIP